MFWKVLGSILLLKYGITISQFLYFMCRLYLLPKFGFKKNVKKLGEWAVITGATDGIGLAIAKQLARRGMNIVLIARNLEKLNTTAQKLESLGVTTKTIQFDFSQLDGYSVIENTLSNLDVGILVNNVGISYDHPEFFCSYTDEFYESMVNINVMSTLKMTRLVVQGMTQRKRGIVLHMSSYSGTDVTPLLTVYSASKSMVNFLSRGLNVESKSKGIMHQAVTPYFVATKLSKCRPSGIMIPSADSYAAQVVDAIGLTDKMCGFWSHDLMAFVLSLVPESIRLRIVYNSLFAIRKRWISKQAKKK